MKHFAWGSVALAAVAIAAGSFVSESKSQDVRSTFTVFATSHGDRSISWLVNTTTGQTKVCGIQFGQPDIGCTPVHPF